MASRRSPSKIRKHLPWYERLKEKKYTFLFVTLIGFLLFLPLADATWAPIWPLLFFGMLYSTLDALDLPRKVFRLAVGLGMLAVGVHLLWLWTGFNPGNAEVFEFIVVLLYFLFIAACIVVFLLHVFTEREVTVDTIKGGIAVYFLAGLAFAFLFDLVLRVQPGALTLIGGELTLADLTYYSFVTLTTLGYGDIAPQTAAARTLAYMEAALGQARTLAYMEAALGQVYIAVLIARLVGRLGISKKD